MKFWMLVSHFYSEPRKLETIFSDPKWTRYAESFRNFARLVHEQDRAALDAELPPELCRQALSLSTQIYVIERGNLYEIPGPDGLPAKNCLTALEVFESYGGECLEEVREYGCWKIPTNRQS